MSGNLTWGHLFQSVTSDHLLLQWHFTTFMYSDFTVPSAKSLSCSTLDTPARSPQNRYSGLAHQGRTLQALAFDSSSHTSCLGELLRE